MSKGYAAPETKAADRASAKLLIEQAEALGEPPEDHCCCFRSCTTVGRAMRSSMSKLTRDLAAQFLTLAERQGATRPLMIGHRIMGTSLIGYWKYRER